ncbi:hypothetical protein G6F60_014655 [Rhizopus arrhizus]|nr:hypothetical protein G6F60_014655 [Rhizopus arrhizus]
MHQAAIGAQLAFEALPADVQCVGFAGQSLQPELLDQAQPELLRYQLRASRKVLGNGGVGIGPPARMLARLALELAGAAEGDVAALQRDRTAAGLQHHLGLRQHVDALVGGG